MNLEDDFINPGSLTKFRKLRLKVTDLLRERSRLLRKTVYAFDDQLKERMSQKNTDNELEMEWGTTLKSCYKRFLLSKKNLIKIRRTFSVSSN